MYLEMSSIQEEMTVPSREFHESSGTTWVGMGTVVTVKACGDGVAGNANAEAATHAAKAEAERLESLLSRFVPGSDVDSINCHAGVSKVRLGPEALEVLSLAQDVSHLTDGLFDITVCPLVELWGIGTQREKVPSMDEIRVTLGLVDYRSLSIDCIGKRGGLTRRGQSIDLGGIAKGYAADMMLKVMSDKGITSGYVNLGGNVATLGCRGDGGPWRIGIQHPRREFTQAIAAVEVAGNSVVTSADNQRYFYDSEGNRCHHILHPHCGVPAKSGLISATIVTRSSALADAVSTACFVAGLPGGLRLLDRMREYWDIEIEAFFVTESEEVWCTPGLTSSITAMPGTNIRELSEYNY